MRPLAAEAVGQAVEASPSWGMLELIHYDTLGQPPLAPKMQPDSLALHLPSVTVGRATSSQIRLNKQLTWMSNRHFELGHDGTRAWIRDFSSHGTWLNGVRLEKHAVNTLRNSDYVELAAEDTLTNATVSLVFRFFTSQHPAPCSESEQADPQIDAALSAGKSPCGLKRAREPAGAFSEDIGEEQPEETWRDADGGEDPPQLVVCDALAQGQREPMQAWTSASAFQEGRARQAPEEPVTGMDVEAAPLTGCGRAPAPELQSTPYADSEAMGSVATQPPPPVASTPVLTEREVSHGADVHMRYSDDQPAPPSAPARGGGDKGGMVEGRESGWTREGGREDEGRGELEAVAAADGFVVGHDVGPAAEDFAPEEDAPATEANGPAAGLLLAGEADGTRGCSVGLAAAVGSVAVEARACGASLNVGLEICERESPCIGTNLRAMAGERLEEMHAQVCVLREELQAARDGMAAAAGAAEALRAELSDAREAAERSDRMVTEERALLQAQVRCS